MKSTQCSLHAPLSLYEKRITQSRMKETTTLQPY
jgi:hypothetical protein